MLLLERERHKQMNPAKRLAKVRGGPVKTRSDQGDRKRDFRSVWDLERPWLRQPCDTDLSWSYFQLYKYQQPGRRKLPEYTLDVIRWHSEHVWDYRVQRYDQNRDERRALAVETREDRNLFVAFLGQHKGAAVLKRALREHTVKPELAWRMAREGVLLERTIAGLDNGPLPPATAPTSTFDPERLTPAELEAYAALSAKARGEVVAEPSETDPQDL